MADNALTVETVVNAPMAKVWDAWNKPEHITQWAFASDDWEAPAADNDVRDGGVFTITMAARDGSESFDLTGTYTAVKQHQLLEYDMPDGRHVKVEFSEVPGGVRVVETFDPETENPPEFQRSGWQAILDNFKAFVERTPKT
jgi:uncharacterized protein YndB with AHSA1/START domain